MTSEPASTPSGDISAIVPLRIRLIGPSIIAVATIVMTLCTWTTWPDAFYDFGSQLYYAWQLAAGKTLYIDIAYFNGPLSQYFNALLFRVFGVSLLTLVFANLLILCLVLSLLFRLMADIGNRFTATVGCLTFVLVFAFGQYVGIGNYNWICPYTHEVTHGIALSLAAISAMSRFFRDRRVRWLVVTGFFLGLSFLTKAEIFAPLAAAIACGLILTSRAKPHPRDPGLRLITPGWNVLALIIPAVFPAVIAWGLLYRHMPGVSACRAILGSWPWVFNSQIAHLQFYRLGLGIDDVTGNLLAMLFSIIGYTVVLGALCLAAKLPPRSRWASWVIAGILVIALLIEWQAMTEIARPWPVFIAMVVVTAIRRARTSSSVLESQRSVIRATLCVFSVGLLGKMLLNVRIPQYGFALAMPAAMLLIDALLIQLPAWVDSRKADGRFFPQAAISLLATVVLVHLVVCQWFIADKMTTVGTGADAFLAGTRGAEVESARRIIDQKFAPSATLAVLPQGLMLNYLTRRENPLPSVNLMPPEMISTGEDRVLNAFIAHPPDVIVLSQKDLASGNFVLTEGHSQYGENILFWVKQHYQVLGPLSMTPGSEQELKLVFLRKR